MIELTHTNGEKLNVDPDYIILIGDHDATIPEAKAEIALNNTILLVCETRQEVVRKVLEWKYIMQKGAYTNTQGMARLRELAGLEEGK